jgi:hypothetical protein
MFNFKKIVEHNKTYKKKKFNFTCAINRYSDMTTKEFVAEFAGLSKPIRTKRLKAEANSFQAKFKAIFSRLFLPLKFMARFNAIDNPADLNLTVSQAINVTVDWREIGAVLPIRQQVN